MAVTVVFLLVVISHMIITTFHYRAGFFLFVFLYGIYPRFFALGLSDEGFALTGQRAMLLTLAGYFTLRALWGSAEVRRAIEVLKRQRTYVIWLGIFLGARLLGNVVTGRVDAGSIGALVSETLLSAFIFVLVITYVRTRSDIHTLISLIMVSLFINQLTATYEFSIGESIFPATMDLQYEDIQDDEDLLEGKTRANTYRAMGFFDNPLELAGLLCLGLPLALSLAATSNKHLIRVLGLFCVMLAVPTALFTGSRAALGMTLLVLVWYLYQFVSRGLGGKARFFLAVVGVVFALGGVLSAATGLLEALLFGEGYASSTSYRVFQYIYGYEALQDSPLFGFGYARNIGDVVDIRPLDSFYLRMLLEGGIVAFVAVLALLVKTMRVAGAIRRQTRPNVDHSLAHAIGVSMTVALIVMLVLSLPADRLYVFLLMGLAVVLLEMPAQDERGRSNTAGAIKSVAPG